MIENILASILIIIIIVLMIIPLSLMINSTTSNNNIFLNVHQQAMAAQAITTTKFPYNILIDYNTIVAMINTNEEANFSIYENPVYGIKIDYPISW
jgi:hypothetical protein